jgi:hypothetical protein
MLKLPHRRSPRHTSSVSRHTSTVNREDGCLDFVIDE